MALTSDMETALAAPALLLFYAVKIEFPDFTLRLVDGSAALTLFGEAYTGRDDTYGTLGGIEAISDGVEQSAPALGITLLPASRTAAVEIAQAANQGAPVSIWEGLVDRATGRVVADPDLKFAGEIDTPNLSIGKGVLAVTLNCVSFLERLFDGDTIRLNNSTHEAIWPGEKGLEYVTDVQRSLPWGQDAPRPALTQAS